MRSQQSKLCKYENVGRQGHGQGQLNVMIKVNFRLCVIQKKIIIELT